MGQSLGSTPSPFPVCPWTKKKAALGQRRKRPFSCLWWQYRPVHVPTAYLARRLDRPLNFCLWAADAALPVRPLPIGRTTRWAEALAGFPLVPAGTHGILRPSCDGTRSAAVAVAVAAHARRSLPPNGPTPPHITILGS